MKNKNEEEVTVHDFRYDEGFRNRKKQISPTLTTQVGRHGDALSGQPLIAKGVTVRRLTPKECWRLMGFDDEDFEKAKEVNSDSQLYKQAGNSIVVNVLMAIFGQML